MLEARHKTGGAADTMSPWPDDAPDIKVNTLSYVMSLMPPSHPDGTCSWSGSASRCCPQGMGYLPLPDGGSIVQSRRRGQDARVDRALLQEGRRRVLRVLGVDRAHRRHHGAAADADAAARLGSKKPKDIKDVAQLGWALRKQIDQRTVADITRLFTMSATDLLDRWFESPVMKGFMAVNGIIGTWAGPDAPGTAYVLMHHSVGDIGDGEVASWGYPGGRHGRGRRRVRRSRRGSSAPRSA